MKIDKRYTIVFSYAGIRQYADFYEKDGKLVNPSFRASYSKAGETPSIENLETIEEVLEVIRKFAYCNKADLHLINGLPINYYNNEKARKCVKGIDKRFVEFIEKEAVDYFEKVLEPLMKKNKWFVSSSHIGMPILIERNEEGEWDNIKGSKEFDFEYLCYKFVSNFREIEVRLKSEANSPSARAFNPFLNSLPSGFIEEKGYWKDADDLD